MKAIVRGKSSFSRAMGAHLTILVLGIVSLLLAVSGSHADVAIIAHRSVPVDTLDQQRLLDLYTGDIRSWTDETAVVFVDLELRGEVKHTFYRYLGKTPSRIKSIWMRNLLSGKSRRPESMSSEFEVMSKVAETPGAVGFVDSAKATNEVKTLILISSTE